MLLLFVLLLYISHEKVPLGLLIWRSERPIILAIVVPLRSRLLPDLILVLNQDVLHGPSELVLLLQIPLQFLLQLLLLALPAFFLRLGV